MAGGGRVRKTFLQTFHGHFGGGADFLPRSRTKEKRPPGNRKDAGSFSTGERTEGLLRVMHLGLGSRLDFLELWKRTQAGSFRLTGAAAGSGQEREDGSDEGGDNTDHGNVGAGFMREMSPAMTHAGRLEITWKVPRTPAGWERERNLGSRKRRKARQRRR